jgi:hypothetical protein
MARRKKTSQNLTNTNFQKAIDELIKKKFDIEIDLFLKKYINNFLRDFENRQKRNLSNDLISSIFDGGENGNFQNKNASERQIMSSLFNSFLKKIF